MAQQAINAAKANRRLASLILVGLLWIIAPAIVWAGDSGARANGGVAPLASKAAGKMAVGTSSGLLLYNPANGGGTTGVVYPGGQFYTQVYYPPGSFATGWSHIVRANGLLFFYRQTDGLWATARVDQNGYVSTLRSGYLGITPAYNGTPYFIHVVSTPNGIVICHGSRDNYDPEPGGGIVGQVGSDGSFRVTQNANFAVWANVVNTPNGLMFFKIDVNSRSMIVAVGRIQPNGVFVQTYSTSLPVLWLGTQIVALGNDLVFLPYAYWTSISLFPQLSGQQQVGTVTSAGQFTLRSSDCSPDLAGGYVIPAVIGSDLFLYAQADTPSGDYTVYRRRVQAGWAAVGTISSGNIYLDPACRGKLSVKREYPGGSFSPGWDQIVYTTNGVFFYNSSNADAAVGSFDAAGNFTQTQSLYNQLNGGYKFVVNITD